MGEYLRECLDSLLNQKTSDIEIILVNDGSTDNSLSICKEYQEKDSRIVVVDQKNSGANVARNAGIDRATGEWVYFVDGDDCLNTDVCTVLEKYMNADLDVIIFSYNKLKNGAKIPYKTVCSEMFLFGKDFRDLQLSTLNRMGPYQLNMQYFDCVSIWNKLYRRSFLRENNLKFVENMPKLQDLTFNLKVYECAKKGQYVNEIIYNYRINEKSVSNRYQPNIDKKFEIINAYLKKFVEDKNDSEFYQAFHERIATHLRTCIVLKYCNKNNPSQYRKRKKQFLKLMNQEPYCTAMKNVDVSHFNVQERILSWLIKHRLFIGCEVLNLTRNKLLH